ARSTSSTCCRAPTVWMPSRPSRRSASPSTAGRERGRGAANGPRRPRSLERLARLGRADEHAGGARAQQAALGLLHRVLAGLLADLALDVDGQRAGARRRRVGAQPAPGVEPLLLA